jgi:hypothetical protein
MNRLLRFALVTLCVAVGASISACAHVVELGDLTADSGSGIHSREGQKIDGYTRTDQVYYRYNGWVRLDGPDSLRFSPVQFELEGKTHDPPPAGVDKFTLPVSEVKSLNLD